MIASELVIINTIMNKNVATPYDIIMRLDTCMFLFISPSLIFSNFNRLWIHLFTDCTRLYVKYEIKDTSGIAVGSKNHDKRCKFLYDLIFENTKVSTAIIWCIIIR